MQPYELIRSGRRTLALELRGGRVIVRAPYRTPRRRSTALLPRTLTGSRAGWPNRRPALPHTPSRRTPSGRPTSGRRRAYLPQRVAYYSERMGLYPTQVRITGARTRFGSCGSQGHICFSWRLMQYRRSDRLRRRARAGAPALHEPRRGVLRAHRALSAGLEGPAAPCCGQVEKAPEDDLSSGAFHSGIDFCTCCV